MTQRSYRLCCDVSYQYCFLAFLSIVFAFLRLIYRSSCPCRAFSTVVLAWPRLKRSEFLNLLPCRPCGEWTWRRPCVHVRVWCHNCRASLPKAPFKSVSIKICPSSPADWKVSAAGVARLLRAGGQGSGDPRQWPRVGPTLPPARRVGSLLPQRVGGFEWPGVCP